MRDDNTSTGGQWDNPMGKGNQDNTGSMGGNTHSPQNLGQSGNEYGSQPATGPGGTDVQSARYLSSGPLKTSPSTEYGGPPTGQTAGYVDPRLAGAGGRQTDDDDEYRAAVGPGVGHTGKPSMTNRVKGAAEKMAGKITGDPVKEARGREREEGNF